MTVVVHKYMPAEMSTEERVATFAARHHTLDHLIKILRDQIESQTLNSMLLTGPRGAGKTTLVLMLLHAIETQQDLRKNWLPVHFPEELPAVASLRDLMSEALHVLSENGNTDASQWREKTENESDDSQSLEIATTGLRTIAKARERRLVFMVENLDMIFERGLDDTEEAHLRRLLMSDPFFLIVGTAVRLFPAVSDYEQAFFNFFTEIPLDRLKDDQVEELLFKRADFHNNEIFRKNYRDHRPSVRAISRLTGGNPRLITMLYEVLSQREIQPVVNLLRQIVDELTPLLKDVLENLPKQQSKVFDALMRKGGTASPSELVEPTRLTLNAVTTQLTRLREAQLVEVEGGGKGRKAYYTVPDQLFCTWYQMRYLRPNRRRIEMIVEFLRVCLHETERLEHLQKLSTTGACSDPGHATTLEYFAATFAGTIHEEFAREAAIRGWMQVGKISEAAFALAEFETASEAQKEKLRYTIEAYGKLGRWHQEHEDLESAIRTFEESLRIDPENIDHMLRLAIALALSDRESEAIDLWTRVIDRPELAPIELVAQALINRSLAKEQLNDTQGAIEDYTVLINLDNIPVYYSARALYNRGVIKGKINDTQEAIKDYTELINNNNTPIDLVTKALINRGVAKGRLADAQGAFEDYTALIDIENAPVDQVAEALFNRAFVKGDLDDTQGAIGDFDRLLALSNIDQDVKRASHFALGIIYISQGITIDASEHFESVLNEGDFDNSQCDILINAIFEFANWHEITSPKRIFEILHKILLRFDNDESRQQAIISALANLAKPEQKDIWLKFWNGLESALPEEEVLLDLLRPAALYLESGNSMELRKLPADQRTLVETILEGFSNREKTKLTQAKEAE